MPRKRLHLLEQILQVKAADLFQCVRTVSGQYVLQVSLLTKVKTEISNSSIQVLIFFKKMKLRFLDLSVCFL